ncbi:hypothetical protein NB689_002109 [Xanthomonas sacchari]|nr:hypothetical protein [Xanthomonas sacchari]
MPVSRTENSSLSLPGSAPGKARTDSTTSPCSVNLMALPTRLISTWFRRSASPCSQRQPGGSGSTIISTGLALVAEVISAAMFSSSSLRSNGADSRSMRPDSILEKSRMSLMISSRLRADSSIFWIMSCAACDSALCRSRYSMPRIAFIGVRISWLMLARKSLLDWLALSAASIARRSSRSRRFCSVRSTAMPR